MKLGISTASFFGKSLTENSLDVIKGMNASTCEVFFTTFYEYEDSFGQLLKSKLDSYGGCFSVHSIHSLNSHFEPQLYNRAERTYGDAEKIYRDVLRNGRTVGAKYYTFHGPSRFKAGDREKRDFDYARLGLRTAKLVEIAEEYGIRLCYENVHWTNYWFNGYFSRLCEYAPKLGACLDVKQAMQSKVDYRLFLDEMGERLCTVHVCDYDADGRLAMPGDGKGIFDFEELFKRLYGMGFNGSVILELYSDEYGGFDQVKNSFDYLCELNDKVKT